MDELREGSVEERLWERTVEHSPVATSLVGLAGELLSVNAAWRDLLGYTGTELHALTFEQITHPDDRLGDRELFDLAAAGSAVHRSTKRYLHASGAVVRGDLSVSLLRSDDGSPVHFIAQSVVMAPRGRDSDAFDPPSAAVDPGRRLATAILDNVDIGLVLVDRHGYDEWTNLRHRDLSTLAFPARPHDRAGRLGHVFAADGVTPLTLDEMPSSRSALGQEFDDYRIWVGADRGSRRALSVSARNVLDTSGQHDGAALAYSDITDLMSAAQEREGFLAGVSHELKTPLTSVLGHLEMLLDDDLPVDVLHRLGIVQRNAEHLEILVSDLLEGAQFRAGNLTLTRSCTDVAALVGDAVESTQPLARMVDVDLVADVPVPVLAVVDHHRVRQVVDNLVSNAVKYTDPGGRVCLDVRTVGQDIEISVSDTGIGISSGDLDRLRIPFFRARDAQRRTVPGIGLGLTIADAIVAAHGGRIVVTSRRGEGSTFLVRMPLGPGNFRPSAMAAIVARAAS